MALRSFKGVGCETEALEMEAWQGPQPMEIMPSLEPQLCNRPWRHLRSQKYYVSCVQGLGVTQPCCESQLCHLLVGDLRYGGDFLPSTYSLDLSYTPDLCIPLACLTDSSN